MDATLSKDPTRPYRLIRHGHVFDCRPFDVPLLGVWSEPDFFAQFNDEEKARWNTSAARTTGLSQEYGELHHILSGVYNEYARDTFRDSTTRMTGDAKVVQAISVIFADEIDRLSEMECRALGRELMARCKLKSGQLIQIGKERVRFLSMTVVRRPYRTTLQITGQPIFSDGSPAGDAKTFDLNAYEAQNVRPVESR
jgi:hypothetical protein